MYSEDGRRLFSAIVAWGAKLGNLVEDLDQVIDCADCLANETFRGSRQWLLMAAQRR